MKFLAQIFDSSGVAASWQSGSSWAEAPWLGWLHIISDLGVWSAFLAIPIVLAYFLQRRKDLPNRRMLFLFGAFILVCGTTYLIDAITIWWPIDRLAEIIKLLAAIISWVTVISLIQLMPEVANTRSHRELEQEITARKRIEAELQVVNAELEKRVQERTADLKLTADALRNERELLRTTLRSIGDGVVATDTEGRVTFLNRVAEKLTGWVTTDAQGQQLDDVFHICSENPQQAVDRPARRALQEGISVVLASHVALQSRDGTERPIDVNAAPIRGGVGAVRGAVLVFRDITERKSYLTNLRDQEERLRLAIDATGLGIFDDSLLTGEKKWSDRCKEIWGLSPHEEVRPAAILNSIHPYDRDRVKQTLRQSLDPNGPGQFVIEYRLLLPNGTERWLMVRGKTIFDKSSQGPVAVRSLGTMLDITDRKQAEEALRQSELREKQKAAELKTVLRATPTPIWISHDSECRHVTGNPASYRLLGSQEGVNVSATPATPITRTFQEYRNGVPIPGNELPLQMAATQGIEVVGAEMSILAQDGILRHLYGNASPIRSRDGSVRGAVAAFMDITELKTSEQALKEADRRKDEFLAILAHELRNPLAPIRNSLEMMKRANGDLEILERSRRTMERQMRQLVRLVDDLIDVSRVSRNRLELRKDKVDLASIIEHATEACRPLAESANHQLHVSLPSEPIYLHADAIRLAQVFGNLLTNSCKYSEQNGNIHLTASRVADEVVVTIQDQGIGIPPEMLTKVFEMFTQVDRSLERKQGGLGIGLTLAKRLIEMHGGTVTARSEGLGRGSEFIVRLPLYSDQQEISILPESIIGVVPGGRRVLVVDDNHDSAQTLAMLLQMTGNDVQTAHDGMEAVEKAESGKPDLILLDIGLPKLNGFDACRAIREKTWGRDIFIVALTGWGQEDDRRRSKEAGFNDHLVKPIDQSTLAKVLAETRIS